MLYLAAEVLHQLPQAENIIGEALSKIHEEGIPAHEVDALLKKLNAIYAAIGSRLGLYSQVEQIISESVNKYSVKLTDSVIKALKERKSSNSGRASSSKRSHSVIGSNLTVLSEE